MQGHRHDFGGETEGIFYTYQRKKWQKKHFISATPVLTTETLESSWRKEEREGSNNKASKLWNKRNKTQVLNLCHYRMSPK